MPGRACSTSASRTSTLDGHVPGAVLIPLGEVGERVEELSAATARSTSSAAAERAAGGPARRWPRTAWRGSTSPAERSRGSTAGAPSSSGTALRDASLDRRDRWSLEAFVDLLLAEPRYALDTEFHRERTYFPKLALLQIASADEIVLIDPISCSMTPLVRLFVGPSLAP